MLEKKQSRSCAILIISFALTLTLSFIDSLSAAESDRDIRAGSKKSCTQVYVKDASYTEEMNEVYCSCVVDGMHIAGVKGPLTEEFWTKDFDDLVKKNNVVAMSVSLCDVKLKQRFPDRLKKQ
jgi:hypothetical protein